MPEPNHDRTPAGSGADAVEVEAPSFEEAVREAASRLGVAVTALGLDVVDPGRSAASEGGFRPVKLRAWVRSASAPPDGARGGSGSAGPSRPRRERGGDREMGRGVRRHFESESHGPPPPPLDAALITPVHVERARSLAGGIVHALGFPADVAAEKTRYGIRVAISAGDRDPALIGHEGEALGAIQHLVARMMRAGALGESVPRVEVDVAGYRDRRNEELRELARDLIAQVRAHGGEAWTDPLPPAERRIVHLEVAEVAGMTSMSTGDALEKRIVVREAEGGPPGMAGRGKA